MTETEALTETRIQMEILWMGSYARSADSCCGMVSINSINLKEMKVEGLMQEMIFLIEMMKTGFAILCMILRLRLYQREK